MDADGTNQRDVGLCPGIESCGKLAWSPNGRRVAYAQGTDLYVADLASGTSELLVSGELKPVAPPYGEGGPGPTWSPNGKSLAFTCGDALCTVDAAGGEPRVIGPELTDPDWSPDGNRLVGEYWPGSGSPADIFIHRLDGPGRRPLTNSVGNGAFHPSWAPDGGAIVYYDEFLLYRDDLDGSGPVKLTSGPRDFTPDWGPPTP